MIKTLLIMLTFFGLSSCNQTEDTSEKPRILFYKNSHGFDSSICIYKSDTIIFPKLIYSKEIDSLFVFVPQGWYKKMDLILGADSVDLMPKVAGQPFKSKFEIKEFRKSKYLKMVPEMISRSGKIAGTLWCTDSTGFYRVWLLEEINYR